MASTFATLIGGRAAAGTTLEDLIATVAPGLSFPSYIQGWLRFDISHVIGLLSLFSAMLHVIELIKRILLATCAVLIPFVTASASVPANDQLNEDVVSYLQNLSAPGTRIVTAHTETIDVHKTQFWNKKSTRDDSKTGESQPVAYTPTFGSSWHWHGGSLLVIRRASAKSYGPMNSGTPDQYATTPNGKEPLLILCLGRSLKPIYGFLDACREHRKNQRKGFVSVHTRQSEIGPTWWNTNILKPKRDINTIYLNEEKKRNLMSDIEEYLKADTQKYYQQCGIPYRRGYLLHGPPGTGKSSLGLALASYFNVDMYIFELASIRSDEELKTLFSLLPRRCIVLLEDIDAVGLQNRKRLAIDCNGPLEDSSDEDERPNGFQKRSACSLSGLLNAIDGVASPEGRIIIMTTNAVERIDPALIRDGRIDLRVYLGNVDVQSAKSMFLAMYKHGTMATCSNAKNDPNSMLSNIGRQTINCATHYSEKDVVLSLAHVFFQQIPNDHVSPAKLQGYLLKHKNDPTAAVDNLEGFLKECKK